jgi:hypothetical protein
MLRQKGISWQFYFDSYPHSNIFFILLSFKNSDEWELSYKWFYTLVQLANRKHKAIQMLYLFLWVEV